MSQNSLPHMNPPPDANKSILEYAVHHRIAEDPIATPAGSCLKKGLPSNSSRSGSRLEVEKNLEGGTEDLAFTPDFNDFESSKLSITTEEGRFLSKMMQDKEVEIDWNALLPPLSQSRFPKLEDPLLTEEEEEHILSKGQELLDSEMIDEPWDETAALHEEQMTETLQDLPACSMTDILGEKLDCGRESLAFIADIQGDSGRSPEESRVWLDSVIGKYNRGAHRSDDTLQESDPTEEAKSPSPVQLVPLPGLGNLSSFLSTRGITTSAPSESPYFAQGEPTKKPEEDESPQTAPTSPETILNITAPPASPIQDAEEFVCFVSTQLLKSRLSHIRHLDAIPSCQPIYRDYDPKSQPEADIIISPRTGIILTSAHTLTQKYLPGSKGSRNDIKSPIMERIYRTAPRYETLYIFICVISPKADEQIQDAVTSMASFCDSLSEDTTVIPMVVSETDGAVASWVEYLGHTELSSLPVIQSLRQPETRWEVRLREYGLNPFAARLVLDLGIKFDMFIEMGAERRQSRFRDLLGERVLRRVGEVIKRDRALKGMIEGDD